MGDPASHSRDCEEHWEHIGGEAHCLVDHSRVEVHVGVELALDELLVLQGDSLQLHSDLYKWLLAQHVKDIIGSLANLKFNFSLYI